MTRTDGVASEALRPCDHMPDRARWLAWRPSTNVRAGGTAVSDSTQVIVTVDLEDQYRFTVDFHQAGVAPLLVDEPPPLGGGQGPNPARLLVAAITNCLAASAVFCLRKSRIDVHGMHAEATASMERNERDKWRIPAISVRLHPEIAEADPRRVARCLELFEDYCVVTQSVRGGVAVDVQVTPVVVNELVTQATGKA